MSSTRDVDAIVIGSGAGGLTAALALARAGRRVLVLEQHYVPGGFCHSFTLGGHRFSPGVHYVGELGPGGRLRAIYEGLGVAGDVSFAELDPDGYDRVLAAGQAFELPKTRAALAGRLSARFPHQIPGIHRYLETIEQLAAEVRLLMKAGPSDLALLLVRAPTLCRHGLGSLAALLDRCEVTDPFLRAILSVQCGDHGLPPSRAPAALHATVAAHYFDGGWYPVGGGFAIPRAFVRALERAGGELRLSTAVERILTERAGLLGGRRVVGVRLADGSEVRAPLVISNADPAVTFGRLLAPEEVPARVRWKLQRTRWGISALSLFLAVDMDLRAAGLDSGNVWWSRGLDPEAAYAAGADPRAIEAGQVEGLFLTATTLKDPTKGDGRVHTLEAFTLAAWDPFAAWADTPSGQRPGAYEALKARLERGLLAAVERVVPGLRERVVFQALGTPLTNQHYVNATRGSLYGTEKSLLQLGGPLGWDVRTPLGGLYLCGASTLGHGVMGATMSGIAAARAALGCRTRDLLRQGEATLRTWQAEDPATWPERVRRDVTRRSERGAHLAGDVSSAERIRRRSSSGG